MHALETWIYVLPQHCMQQVCFSFPEKVPAQVVPSVLWYFEIKSITRIVDNALNECCTETLYWRRKVEEIRLHFFGLVKRKLGRSTQTIWKVNIWKVTTREWWLFYTSTGNRTWIHRSCRNENTIKWVLQEKKKKQCPKLSLEVFKIMFIDTLTLSA